MPGRHSEEEDPLSSSDEDPVDNEYYGFLNVPRNASNVEITAAYKRLARLYHPDKHQDAVKREEADLLFTKLKRCYEVLIDPHKRAIYDCLGKEGLQEQGWAVVQRSKTPREIREEYEAIARVREERRLQQRTNPVSRFQMTVNCTDLFDRYLYESEYDDIIDSQLPQFEISKISLFSSIQAPLTTTDTTTLSGNISTSNGRGEGGFNVGYRRFQSESAWQEFSLGLGSGLGMGTKYFRKLGSRVFGNMSGTLQFARSGIKPGFSTTLETHLDKNTVGYLTYSTNLSLIETSDSIALEQEQSGMETMIVRDTPKYHMVASVQLGIPYTYAMISYTRKIQDKKKKLRSAIKFNGMLLPLEFIRKKSSPAPGITVGTFGAILEYGVEERITEHSTLGATMVVGFPVGVTVRIKLVRASQTYLFPFHLSDEVILQPIFYGTVVPLLAWFTVKKLILDPYESSRKEKERERRSELNKEKVSEARREALASSSLMAERYKRISKEEEDKGGLVILYAAYGLLATDGGELKPEFKNIDNNSEENSSFIDITVPLQCTVEDSRLILWEGSKCNLPGVWDPAPEDDKYILIKYLYQNSVHQVFCPETGSIKLPKTAHRIS
ncbi:dnaJ homolog subfamily C member 11 isoform X2 [Eurytemora carolleeae]|uniref:dnaJ homolog subfamily C member 11 isoform X2 n=1 Tax=Eurytemora carolleeae TaxID=1294199 RepID=UPI000C773A81|nr:dnaJ homolog subfamily C member 11 isoform X2 [Eurytemora carolleeae]|eukprot:XP_023330820.1 dnaJ homolog subfamily C member 11-like isoform X2 [Eurytemora affinis]